MSKVNTNLSMIMYLYKYNFSNNNNLKWNFQCLTICQGLQEKAQD